MLNLTEEQKQNAGHLQHLCNKYGDFRVTYLKRNPDGTIDRRKWRSVMQCWDTEEGIEFLGKSNNREPTQIELFLDIDTDYSKEENKEIMNAYCDLLEENGEKYIAYNSGSKGYHIHLKLERAELLTKSQKEDLKEAIINQLSIGIKVLDTLKKSENHMIATENMPHWKTGNIKTKVRGNWDNF